MAQSPLFKRAFVRGLNSELIRQGAVVYPSKEAADISADYIADNSGMPDPYLQPEAVTVKVAEYICDNLVLASQHFCKEAGNRYSPDLTKTAQSSKPEDVAVADAWAVMEKAAAETGSLEEGGGSPNTLPAAAQSNAEAAQELNRRPENYANLGESGVGNYERKGQGSVGVEEKHPEAPKATDAGSNSATENAKQGSLASIIRKIAADDGQLMDPGKMPNDMPAAAQHNAEAAQEMNRRPENYANKGEDGVGRSDMVPTPAQNVGQEMPHPEAPMATDTGMNVPMEHIAKGAAFTELFTSAARELVPYLPERMPEQQKVAYVRAMMGLEPTERATYLTDVYSALGATKEASESVGAHYLKTASAKQAEDMCPAMSYEKKEDKGEEKAEEKKEDKAELPPFMAAKKEESEKSEKKEASRNSLRGLRAALANLA